IFGFSFLLWNQRPRLLTLFPYTTLFRSSSVKAQCGSCEVAPFLWTPDRLGRWVPRKESTCRSHVRRTRRSSGPRWCAWSGTPARSEEHTSELQSRENLVCRLLLEKKKRK